MLPQTCIRTRTRTVPVQVQGDFQQLEPTSPFEYCYLVTRSRSSFGRSVNPSALEAGRGLWRWLCCPWPPHGGLSGSPWLGLQRLQGSRNVGFWFNNRCVEVKEQNSFVFFGSRCFVPHMVALGQTWDGAHCTRFGRSSVTTKFA